MGRNRVGSQHRAIRRFGAGEVMAHEGGLRLLEWRGGGREARHRATSEREGERAEQSGAEEAAGSA